MGKDSGMDKHSQQLLVALFDLAQLDTPASVQALAARLGRSRREVACTLNTLDGLGLVRAEKVRLTLVGLMKASGLRERARQHLAA